MRRDLGRTDWLLGAPEPRSQAHQYEHEDDVDPIGEVQPDHTAQRETAQEGHAHARRTQYRSDDETRQRKEDRDSKVPAVSQGSCGCAADQVVEHHQGGCYSTQAVNEPKSLVSRQPRSGTLPNCHRTPPPIRRCCTADSQSPVSGATGRRVVSRAFLAAAAGTCRPNCAASMRCLPSRS